MEKTRNILTVATVSFSLLLLSGCGGRISQTRDLPPRPMTVWDQADKSEFFLGDPTIVGTDVSVPVYSTKIEKEFSYIFTPQEYRWVTEPNILMILLSPAGFFVPCMDGGCFGKYPSWREGVGSNSNKLPTGNTRKTPPQPNTTRTASSISWTVYDNNAAIIDKSTQSINVYDKINFSFLSLAASLPAAPAQVDIIFALKDNTEAKPVMVSVKKPELSKMNLYSENWLEPDVLSDLLMSRITTALKSKDYKAALPNFEKLEKINSNLPESFHYYYITALYGVGESKIPIARERASNYISKYGKQGTYYAEVIELMSNR